MAYTLHKTDKSNLVLSVNYQLSTMLYQLYVGQVQNWKHTVYSHTSDVKICINFSKMHKTDKSSLILSSDFW